MGGDRLSTKTSKYIPPGSEKDVVLAWIRRAREAQLQHYEMANIFSRRDKWLGIPVIVVTAIIGTSAFLSVVYESLSAYAKVSVGILSIAAAILSSLQTFFKFSEQSEKHRLSAAKYGSTRRKLEVIYSQNKLEMEGNYMNALREELDNLANVSPYVPVKIFRKIQNNILYADKLDGGQTSLECQ